MLLSRNRLILITAVLAMIGLLFVLRFRLPITTKVLTTDERLALIADKNAAMGLLENGDYAKSVPILEQIVEKVPADPLGHRNLVVALLQPNDFGQSAQADPAGVQRLLAACFKLLKVDGTSPITRLLAGRVFEQGAELARGRDDKLGTSLTGEAREQFETAAKLNPSDPAPFFDLYLMEKSRGDPQRISDAAFVALRKTGARGPDNLAFLLEWLEQLSLRKSPDAAATLERTLRALPSDADTPRKLLLEAQSLIVKDSPEAYAKVVAAHNHLKTHASYLQDRSRLLPHPLGFTLSDFKPSFYEGLPKEEEPPIAVKFEPFVPPGSATVPMLAAAWSNADGGQSLDTIRLAPATKPNSTRVEVISPHAQWESPFEIAGIFQHFQPADLDLDIKPGKDRNLPADMDLVLWGPSGLRVLENREENGRRQWVDRTQDAKVPDLRDIQWLTVCDMDHDGNLDLIVGLAKGIHILRNRGEWAFEDITGRSQGLDNLETVAAVYGDFDRDGDLDFFVLNKNGRLIFLENRRSGKFVAKRPEPLDPRPGIAQSLLTFDANNDGQIDLLVGQANGATLYLASRNDVLPQGANMLDFRTNAAVKQASFFDYDNDGWPDVWLLADDSKQPLRLFRNLHGERFASTDNLLPPLQGPLHSITALDADADGDQDLLFVAPKGIQGIRNDGGNQNHWLDLRLRAILNRDAAAGIAAKSNYFDIGGLIEIRSGPFYQMQQVAGPVTHFGLGRRKQADLVRVFWTNGVTQAVLRPSLNQVLAEEQKPKGSCPYLFTWNGREFVFVTDCLFAKDLGLKPAEGVAPDCRRQDTYAVISGDQLKPLNGHYVLQFTDELWEVSYLDLAELIVVDHPAETEICTNQRVPLNEREPFRIHTIRRRRSPLAARNQRREDVLETIRRRDGRCLGGFKQARYVGIAEPHWLELDLGDLSQAKQATLYLTGWKNPTDTTANVAVSQDARFEKWRTMVGGTQAVALLVPDGRGDWTVANPNIGFPPGVMQTLAVELPLDKLRNGDGRILLATARELYWDDVYFTVDESPAELHVNRLSVSKADLHYRGFSRTFRMDQTNPLEIDYHDVDLTPRWLPIHGPFTGYGDTAPLLHTPDSKYVIMSPGDELTLKYSAIPEPPHGWRRSFIFRAGGWLKGFDFNGVETEQTGPFPYDGMSRYPPPPDDSHPRQAELRPWLVPGRSDDNVWGTLAR